MKILIITSYTKTKFILSLRKEGERIGIQIDACLYRDLIFDYKNNEIRIKDQVDILSYDAFILRATPEFRSDLWHFRGILAHFLKSNSKPGININYNCKFWGGADKLIQNYLFRNNGIGCVNTRIYGSRNHYLKIKHNYPLITKKRDTNGGLDVHKVIDSSELKETTRKYNSGDWLVQDYVPIKSDYRVLMLGSNILGMVERVSTKDFRTNFSQGGKFFEKKITNEYEKISKKIRSLFDIDLVGIDLFKYNDKIYCFEINDTPTFEGFELATKINVSKKILSYLSNQIITCPNRQLMAPRI